MGIGLRGLLAGCCLVGLAAGRVEGESRAETAMLTLAKTVLGIEERLTAGDAAGAAGLADEMAGVAGEMSYLTPESHGELPGVFHGYRTDLARLAKELAATCRTGPPATAAQVLAEVRATCVSCHVKFRRRNDADHLFPNPGSVVAGQVRVTRQDGEERTDRGGVVVFLDGADTTAPVPLPRRHPVISQRDQRFSPRVLAVVKGTTVEMPNDDLIFHNIFSLSATRPFDLGIYRPGETRSVTFPTPGWVRVYCNIHPAMVAHILVLTNPLYAVTDELGLFVIPGVPDGRYLLRTWHEFGGEISRPLSVAGPALVQVSLPVQEDTRFVPHRNKFGEPYRDAY